MHDDETMLLIHQLAGQAVAEFEEATPYVVRIDPRSLIKRVPKVLDPHVRHVWSLNKWELEALGLTEHDLQKVAKELLRSSLATV